MTATTDVPIVGAIVHYVPPNGRCRPALVIEHAAALATAEASVHAVAQVVAAQKTLTNLERASVILDRGSGRVDAASGAAAAWDVDAQISPSCGTPRGRVPPDPVFNTREPQRQ